MDFVKLNKKNSFDPTPKLNSSPVPIFFFSFNKNDNNCFHCGIKYTLTLIYGQKYCEKCLSCYLIKIDNNMYLDVYLTKDLAYIKHEISKTKVLQDIQVRCRNSLIIKFFKQIIDSYDDYYEDSMIERYCKLCGKSIYQGTEYDIMRKFKLCSNCYLISSGCIESTLTKKLISIIYLPWWETRHKCFCHEELVFTSNCQKYCENCSAFFIGCRYCLTTNIIFGITNQSQCKKCKRVSTIIIFDITKIISGNSDLDDFLVSLRSYQSEITKFTDAMKNIDKYFIPSEILRIFNKQMLIKYIPYSRFTNVKEIAKGGFSIIYQSTWLDGSKYADFSDPIAHEAKNQIVILKRFKNLQYAKKYFLNEVNSLNICIILFNVYKIF
jgi:hypothetical protein